MGADAARGLPPRQPDRGGRPRRPGGNPGAAARPRRGRHRDRRQLLRARGAGPTRDQGPRHQGRPHRDRVARRGDRRTRDRRRQRGDRWKSRPGSGALNETTSSTKAPGDASGAAEGGGPRPRAIGASSSGAPPWLDLIQRFGAVILLILVCVVFSIMEPDSFATWQNARTILQQEAVLACLALGLLLPIAVGEFDLSVGYVLGFSAVIAASLGGESNVAGGLVIPIVLLSGLAIGAFNGILVAKFKIHSLIATLGVGFA